MLHLIRKKKYEREKEEKIININNSFNEIQPFISFLYDTFKLEPFFLIQKKEYIDFCTLKNIYYLGDLFIQYFENHNQTIQGHMDHILRFSPQNLSKENIIFFLTAKLFIYLKDNQHLYIQNIQQIIYLKKYIDNGIKVNILEISELFEFNHLFDSVSLE